MLPQRCSSLSSTVDLQCLILHCLARLYYSRLETCSSAVGQRHFLSSVLVVCWVISRGSVFIWPSCSKFQSHLCSHKMVIAACISPSSYSSCREWHHMLLTMRWSSWFSSRPFGDIQVSLWMLRCGNKVTPMIIECTPLYQPLSIVVLDSTSLSSHYPFKIHVVQANLGIKVTYHQQEVPAHGSLYFGHCCH